MKISSVGPTSTSSPSSMKAVRSATRAACCMLWVTITIVTRVLSWSISSSIFSVAIGSSAEQGSSIRITSGSTASERAMHSRCCWPPESPAPGSCEAILDLVPQPGAAQRRLDLGACRSLRARARSGAARRRRCRRSTSSGTGWASGRPSRSRGARRRRRPTGRRRRARRAAPCPRRGRRGSPRACG